jgi:putative iron-dependent peroxidase
MTIPQPGIFALGDASHGYFEFAHIEGTDPLDLVVAVADLGPPHTTVGGANLVVGYRPEFWRSVAGDAIPGDVRGFDEPLRGPGGYEMPATQADVFVWFSAAAYDIVFDLGRETVAALAPYARLVRESTGWSYKHSRDLTGFEDGTENPTMFEAPEAALVPDGGRGAGGSVVLFQRWRHHSSAWNALAERTQEEIIGRTKLESIELEEDEMPIGGPRDALTNYSEPQTGAYYFCPSLTDLQRFRTPEDDD